MSYLYGVSLSLSPLFLSIILIFDIQVLSGVICFSLLIEPCCENPGSVCAAGVLYCYFKITEFFC